MRHARLAGRAMTNATAAALSYIDAIDAEIRRAWTELAIARARANRSPNAVTCAAEEHCEDVVNRLLERRHKLVRPKETT